MPMSERRRTALLDIDTALDRVRDTLQGLS